jgi:hypothetical protein
MTQRFNIYFAGRLLPGENEQQVRVNLGRLFNADATTLDKLFSGKLVLLKRGCDQVTAEKYQRAMERAGALPVVKAETPEVVAPERSASTAPPAREMTTAERIAAVAAGTDDTPATAVAPSTPAAHPGPEAYSVAATGSPVLREEERRVTQAPPIDTSALHLEAHTDRLAPEAPPPPQAPDTGHLSLGAAGETIPTLPSAPPPTAPDISGLDLTPPGTDLSDCAAGKVPEPDLDLSNLVLSPAGADILEEEYRRTDGGVAPDTSHLSLRE